MTKGRSKNMTWKIRTLQIAALLLFCSFVLYPNLYIDHRTRALSNLLFTGWKDYLLYEGAFPVWQKGYSKEIPLHPKRTSRYSIYINFKTQEAFDSSKQFVYRGILRLDLRRKGVVVESKVLTASELTSITDGYGYHIEIEGYFLPY